MAQYTKTPIKTIARNIEICAETGKTIRKGKACWLNRKTKKFYCVDAKIVEDFLNNPNCVFK